MGPTCLATQSALLHLAPPERLDLLCHCQTHRLAQLHSGRLVLLPAAYARARGWAGTLGQQLGQVALPPCLALPPLLLLAPAAVATPSQLAVPASRRQRRLRLPPGPA